jgi:hypothetical protein
MTTTVGFGTAEMAPVVAAVRRSWEVHGEVTSAPAWAELASELGLTSSDEVIKSVVVIPRLRTVECVLDAQAKIQGAAADFTALVNAGWKVDALLPVSALGEAHEVFRGLSIALQGWLRSATGELRFTAPETP